MPEIFRTRDTIIFYKGDTCTVVVSPSMALTGWAGGQGVQWFDPGRDELAVDLSDGVPNGFVLWGSDETSDRYTSLTRNQPTYGYGTVGFGGWLLATRTFEQFTLASRLAPPEVEIVYNPQDILYFSLRGLWTREDEWSISGDPRAPNTYPTGVVVQPPSSNAAGYMTIQVRL